MINTQSAEERKQARALIVDDNPVNVIAGGMMLRNYGVLVEAAASGREAVDMVMSKEYDLVFMDIMMPEMDGVQTTKLIHSIEHKEQQVIIAISGAMVEGMESYMKEGEFSDLLEKPIEVEKLGACLKRWLPEEKLDQMVLESVKDSQNNKSEQEKVQEIFKKVITLDIHLGLHYAMGSIENYLRIAEASIRQIQQTISKLELITSENDRAIVEAECHSLKSVLNHLGTKELAQEAGVFSQKESTSHYNDISYANQATWISQIKGFLLRLRRFLSELEQALTAYNNSRNPKNEFSRVSTCSAEMIIKQQEKVLFHISRYEYFEIINGLQLLLTMVSKENKDLIHQAMEAAEEFDYENTARLVKIIQI